MEKSITQDDVKNIFHYDDGYLYWKNNVSKNVKSGNIAGCKNKITGYTQIIIKKKMYYAHRLIFLYHNGYLPKYIDHINGNRSDNRIQNLRECTLRQNQYNRKTDNRNKYKIKGVYKDQYGLYIARSSINGSRKYLGRFNNITDAETAVKQFRENNHGEYINHGEI